MVSDVNGIRGITNRLRGIGLRGRLVRCRQVTGDAWRCELVTDDGAANSNVGFPQSYGHMAFPPAGCRPFMVANGGDSGQAVVVAMADLVHVPALSPGDSVSYDNRGQFLHFHAAGADLTVKGMLRVRADAIEWLVKDSILTSVGGYAEKLTHVAEGQLIQEVWHDPAIVTAIPDHHYPRVEEEG